MKKFFLFGSLVAVLLLIAAAIAIYFFGNQVLGESVRKVVVTYGPQVTGTTVELESAEVSVQDGQGKLTGFAIGNPAGFSEENALEVGEMELILDLASLTGDPIIIERIFVDAAKLNYERTLQTSNFDAIMEHVQSVIPASSEEPQPEPTEETPPQKLIIREVVFSNVAVRGGGMGVAVTADIPTINLQGIGEAEGGVTPAEASMQILGKLTSSAAQAVITSAGGLTNLTSSLISSEGRGELVDKLQDGVSLDGLKNALSVDVDPEVEAQADAAKKLIEGLQEDAETTEEEKKDPAELLKGILGGGE